MAKIGCQRHLCYLQCTMALARFFYKHRRSILAVLLWCFAILSFLQWQQRKIKRKWRHEKRTTELDYGSGDTEIEANLDILLAHHKPQRPRHFEKSDSEVNIKEFNKPENFSPQKISASDCSIKEGVDWQLKLTPKYVTDPDRFLTPVFTYGPNNQLHGFREAIFMAIKLNRTIIAPPFFKHSRNDVTAAEEGDEVVDTYLRLDVSELRNLVSTVPSQSAVTLCNGRFDAIYTTRSAYCSNTKISRLMALCKYLNMDCTLYGKFIIQGSEHGVKYCPKPLIPIYPAYDTIPKTGKGAPFSFIDDLSKINSYYTSNDVCPILGYPYRGISFHKTLEGPRHQGKITRLDREIMRDIVAMTPRPQHVRQSIDGFIKSRIKRNYIAMHWRYNDDDWSMHCKTNHGNQKTCNKILEIMHDASRMGKFFVEYLIDIKRTKNIDIMYIAAPPDEMDMLNRVKIEIMKMLPSVEIYLSTQLLPFLDNYFQNEGCNNYEENRFEILSLAEMEICSRANIFLRSAGSSWSMNINLERVIKDINHFDLQNTALLEEDDE